MAEVSTGSPARRAAMRATFIPCSPSGIAQPRITSSTSLAERPGTLAMACMITSAARSSGLVARPTGVLSAETITASSMACLVSLRWQYLPYSWPAYVKTQIARRELFFSHGLWRSALPWNVDRCWRVDAVLFGIVALIDGDCHSSARIDVQQRFADRHVHKCLNV